MRSFRLLFLSISFCKALAQYGEGSEDPFGGRHKWIPGNQIEGASRTSCPYLNTVANHGFLPRDGRQISIAQFEQSITDSLNFAPDFSKAITKAMLTKLGVITNDATTDSQLRLDLEQTNVHGKTEHDASITRQDLSEGDNLHLNNNLVTEFLKDTLPMVYPYINTTSMGRTRVRRERESMRIGNPPLNDLFEGGAQGEAALIITIFGDDTGPITAENVDSRQVPKDRVENWLRNEMFPTEQGYKKSSRQIQASENKFVVQSVAKWQSWMQDPSAPAQGPGGGPANSNSGQRGTRGKGKKGSWGNGRQGSGGGEKKSGTATNGYFVDDANVFH